MLRAPSEWMGGGGEGQGEPPKVGLSHLIKCLGFEEHLDWLKIDI